MLHGGTVPICINYNISTILILVHIHRTLFFVDYTVCYIHRSYIYIYHYYDIT